jgi:hypothetical protein
MQLAQVSDKEKQAWIQGVGKGTYTAAYVQMMNDYFKTSCILTAAVLRHRLTQQLDWEPFWFSEYFGEDLDLTAFPLLQVKPA